MRSNPLSIDMDFRVIPSIIPLHSPSPDKKSINMIAPTISPTIAEIKKQSTPIRFIKGQKQNYRSFQQQQTDLKYFSHQSDHHSSSALRQKDQIIRNLKNIIEMITQNNRFKNNSNSEQQQLKNQVKILTIQNQKLVNIIQKMTKNKNIEQNTGKIDPKNQTKINQLMKTMKQNQLFYQQQTKQLKRFNKSLNSQIKNLQSQKRDLQQQNKKLLKILKQRNQSQRTNTQKMKLSDTSQNSIEDKTLNIITSKSQQRLSLMKIRQQHSQNLKMLKQGLVRQIQETFDTMKIAIDGMNSKIIGLAKRLESIEKMVWNRVRNTHIERESITISIREGQSHEALQSDRSFKPQKRNNSEIYIQQGPSSSHERASRDQFARLQQIPSQKNLINPLQQQLNIVKTELHELRFKYDKLCLDTSSVPFSDRTSSQIAQISQKYENCLKQIQLKDKQISILYEQIQQIQKNNLIKTQQLQQKLREVLQKNDKTQQVHQQQKRTQHYQTQEKVKILVQTYEKQIEILRKQIINLSSIQKQQTSYTQSPQSLLIKIQQLKNQNSQLSHFLKQARESLHEISQNIQSQRKIFKSSLEQSQKNTQKQQLLKQQLQQKTILLTSEVNQHKIYIESLKYDLSTKTQQFENMKNLQMESSSNFRKQNQVNKKLRQILVEREDEINQLRKLLAEWQTHQIVQQIQKIQTLSANLQKLSQEEILQNVDSAQSYIQELQILRKQNHFLRAQLGQKEVLICQLQSKVLELQNLLQINQKKLIQQQEIYMKTMDKLSSLQKKCETQQSQKKSKIEITKSINSQSKNLKQRIIVVRKIQQELKQKIGRILESDRNVGDISS